MQIQNPGYNKSTGVLLVLLVTIYLLHIAVLFGIGGRDDSYITYWSAHALSQYGEMVNYNGDRVEQSSSLLQVLLLAALHKLTFIPLPTLGILFSLTCGLLAALAANRLAVRLGVPPSRALPFAVVCTPCFTYWASSGMETSLVALVVVLLLLSLHNYLLHDNTTRHAAIAPALAITAYLLVRPESFFVLLAFLVALGTITICTATTTRLQQMRKILLLAGICATLFAALCAWRHLYFGQIFPQPVYAKTDLGNTDARIVLGLKYLRYALNRSTALLVALSLYTLVMAWRQRTQRQVAGYALIACFIAAYLAFVVCSGGDWMEARRMLVPVLPLLVVLTFAALTAQPYRTIFLALLFITAFIDSWRLAHTESVGIPPLVKNNLLDNTRQQQLDAARNNVPGVNAIDTWNYSHLRDLLTIPALDELVTRIVTAGSGPVIIGSRQMGMVPYYVALHHYKQVRFIDLRSLVTRDISECAAITNNQPRSASGILFTPAFYLENQQRFIDACSLPRLDVLYDIGFIDHSVDATREFLRRNGMEGFYFQEGRQTGSLTQYIAIDKRLVSLTASSGDRNHP